MSLSAQMFFPNVSYVNYASFVRFFLVEVVLLVYVYSRVSVCIFVCVCVVSHTLSSAQDHAC